MDKMTTWGDFLEQNWLDREGVKGRGWEKKIKSTISPTWMFHGLLGSHRWTVNLVFLPWPESSKYNDTPRFFFFVFFFLSIDETLLLLIMRKKLLLNTHIAFLPSTRHLNRRRESNSSPLIMHVLSCLCIAEHKIWWHLSLRFHASLFLGRAIDAMLLW
jgi:hypothetical protein